MSGAFKVVLKRPTPPAPKPADSRPVDGAEPKRKRKHSEGGHISKRIKVEAGSEASRPVDPSRPGPRHTSDPRPAERAAVGSEAASEAPAKPRLVIKCDHLSPEFSNRSQTSATEVEFLHGVSRPGAFSRVCPCSGRLKPKAPESGPRPSGTGAPSDRKEHKEKKKKKLRDRPPEQAIVSFFPLPCPIANLDFNTEAIPGSLDLSAARRLEMVLSIGVRNERRKRQGVIQDGSKPRLLAKLPPKLRPAAPSAGPGPSNTAASSRPPSAAVKSEPRSPRPPKVSPRTKALSAVKAEPQVPCLIPFYISTLERSLHMPIRPALISAQRT